METNFDILGLVDLTEYELVDIDGGAHWEVIDGKLVFVP